MYIWIIQLVQLNSIRTKSAAPTLITYIQYILLVPTLPYFIVYFLLSTLGQGHPALGGLVMVSYLLTLEFSFREIFNLKTVVKFLKISSPCFARKVVKVLLAHGLADPFANEVTYCIFGSPSDMVHHWFKMNSFDGSWFLQKCTISIVLLHVIWATLTWLFIQLSLHC